MTARTMSIVLPAFNEAERIGPALGELAISTGGDRARDSAPGSAELPTAIDDLRR
jgi:hypothetical protein